MECGSTINAQRHLHSPPEADTNREPLGKARGAAGHGPMTLCRCRSTLKWDRLYQNTNTGKLHELRRFPISGVGRLLYRNPQYRKNVRLSEFLDASKLSFNYLQRSVNVHTYAHHAITGIPKQYPKSPSSNCEEKDIATIIVGIQRPCKIQDLKRQMKGVNNNMWYASSIASLPKVTIEENQK